MLPRARIPFAILFAVGALSVGCQRVPLLAPSGSTITLTSAATALPLNGTAEIIAQVIEPAGTPPSHGTLITFTTTLGAVQPFEAETDINGRVIVRFLAGTSSGTATITASSGGSNVGTAGAIKIAVGSAAVGRVTVNANPASVPAFGGTTTITVTVFDVNGNPLSAAPVSLSSTAGSLSASAVVTDANGSATATLTTSQQTTVTASVGAQAPPAGGGTTPPAASGQASGSVVVTVSSAPTLVITAPATPPSAGLPAVFTFATTAAAGGGVVRNVTVNWGDGRQQDLGAISGSVPVTHAYQSAGTFVITATLTDSFGNVVIVSTTVVINARVQPVVTLTTTTTNPAAGTDVAFTASVAPAPASGTVIDSVSISYGDGESSSLGPVTGTGIVLHHVYHSGGTYTVVLRAVDSNGGVGTAVTTVFVQAQPPLGVTLSASTTTGTTTSIVTFTATVSGLGNAVVISYLWEFGNGDPPQTTTTNQITHSYAHPSGPFTARVTITTSNGGTASNTTVVTP